MHTKVCAPTGNAGSSRREKQQSNSPSWTPRELSHHGDAHENIKPPTNAEVCDPQQLQTSLLRAPTFVSVHTERTCGKQNTLFEVYLRNAPCCCVLSHRFDRRRRNRALRATMTVLSDIRAAPTAGLRRIPARYSTPAASGMVMALYPVAHSKFCTIFR